ncbi:hypothetical protein ACTFIZ_010074 [Dictyostelium cf. discoideum]
MNDTTSSFSNSTSMEHPKMDLFGYSPSLGLAITAVVCFSIVTLILTALSLKYKKYYFLVACVAGLLETFGYGIRILAAGTPDKIGLYIVTTLFILIPPSALAAVVLFGQLGRIIKNTGIKHPIFTPKRIKYLFLGVDCFSIFMQASGGGLLAQSGTNPSMGNIGKGVMLASLSLALASFTVFFFTIVYLHIKVRQNKSEQDKSWRRIFIALYFSGFLIVLRSIYRVVEYAGGHHSKIMLNEPLFYGLDTLPIFLMMSIWIPFHPGFINLSATKEEVKSLSPRLSRAEA